MSVVFADSGCELDGKELKKIGVECVPLSYVINSKKVNYKANNFNFEEYYSNEAEIAETTTYESVKKLILQAVNTNQEVVIITPETKFFNTHNFAIKAKKEIESEFPEANIYVVSSEAFSVTYASIVYLAGILNSKGINAKELIAQLKKIINSFELLIVPQKVNTKHMQLNAAGSLIGAKPIISYYKEKFTALSNIKGKAKLINEIAEIIKTNGYNIADYPICIACGKNVADAEALKTKLTQMFGDVNIWIKRYNPTIANLFGTNAILICYHIKR